ncbi:hypothetical protein [Plasmodium yoelii yoelii]|uniref:Uncharacterized protein n=1 Tax=Plasmodium yoelii yoelii TaxID=73239 RepID=Q7RAR0_PLAYO|nr:hypothetical protein [Plasmodium yoelii yoelii]
MMKNYRIINIILLGSYNETISALNKNPLNQCTIFHSFINKLL